MFSLRELRELEPRRPLVLEIHEAAVTCGDEMKQLRAALADLQIGLAYDDFGAGQARLVELVDVPPDYLKFDMKLVQNLESARSSGSGCWPASCKWCTTWASRRWPKESKQAAITKSAGRLASRSPRASTTAIPSLPKTLFARA